MKKSLALVAVVLTLASVSGLASCGETSATAVEGTEIAVVTDVGSINDHSFNEACWKGVQDYSADSKVGCCYYQPSADSTTARVATIDSAVSKGAKVIVMPGYLFNSTIKIVQDKYTDVRFLAVDCDMSDDDNGYTAYAFKSNVTSIKYNEHEAGFFAGYAAIKEGYRKLGFLGGMAVPAVVKYGQGFVYGADIAAKELGLKSTDVAMNYWYSGVFKPNDEIATKMTSWYNSGTQVVFSCGGGIYSSCVSAAKDVNSALGTTEKKVIGVDVDQATESPLIITSAMKNMEVTVKAYLKNLYGNKNEWPTDVAAKVIYKGVSDDAVGLPTASDSWRMTKFTVAEYNALYAKVKAGDVTVPAIDGLKTPDTHFTPSVFTGVDYQNA